MIKNIIITVLAIGLILAIAFGWNQQTEARRQEALVVASAQEALIQRDAAEMARKEAEAQREMAMINAMEAQRQREAAVEALEKCRKKK